MPIDVMDDELIIMDIILARRIATQYTFGHVAYASQCQKNLFVLGGIANSIVIVVSEWSSSNPLD